MIDSIYSLSPLIKRGGRPPYLPRLTHIWVMKPVSTTLRHALRKRFPRQNPNSPNNVMPAVVWSVAAQRSQR